MFSAVLLLLPTLMPEAEAAVYKGSYGSNCTYTLDTGTGRLEITGKGPLPQDSAGVWWSNKQHIKSITIGEGFTSVGVGAFQYYSNLVNVTLPSTLTRLGDDAFYSCISLKTINLPIGLKEIGDSSFSGCVSLGNVTLPSSLMYIGGSAFYACASLTDITVPGNATLGQGLFTKCSGLKSVTIGAGITEIPIQAFAYCTSLTSLSLPDTVAVINFSALQGCSALTRFTIPAGVTEIGWQDFNSCTGLTDLGVAPGSPFTVKDGILYNGDGTTLIYCPLGKTAVTVPEGVTSIASYAFDNHMMLTSVTLPQSLTLVHGFNNCPALTKVELGGAVTITNAFGCGLKAVTIPDSVRLIEYSFNYGALENVTFGSGLETISNSFKECRNLKAVQFPLSLRRIEFSFRRAPFTSLTIPGHIEKVDFSFSETPLTALVIEEGVQTVTRSFCNISGLTDITLPESISDISGSFEGCTSLYEVNFKGAAPKIYPIYPSSNSGAFARNATLYYMDGKAGWTVGTWNGYKTAVWTIPGPSIENFKERAYYSVNNFLDVNPYAWYSGNQSVVGAVVRLGIMSGIGAMRFAPDNNITIAELIKMVAVTHSIYENNSIRFVPSALWYQVYVDYAIDKGIINRSEFTNLAAYATRAQMAYLFSKAIPGTELAVINTVNTLPDIAKADTYGNEIFFLYSAGVLAGADVYGTFHPNRSITRAEAAAIITRVALPDTRIRLNFSN